ncbi:MAG: fumarylacetoacetate hydrolase family protein [Bacillota bacterium]|uniref:Fumarylacetoacetate hydrolase family protein n=1 Tax=Virgibacillus salarius TaxID=447199 RepID=A0A941DSM5_9BACI|nr:MULTISPECIES: fumarylacetoacetate hydrolase family protein [Virgibacillus]NAZ08662.1 FAA hydrolase family protein [Agaribacter marinus]MBR7795950.1 fumarylacetoacetate hydrolase family protein [Virgibacillus salarius]MCC2248728.1 fumarylacetoacetate hydrolase family protein [Virgibacillus sp. AGTR]MDY7043977.1 fumarylacetoacetate hydrolase family protein [Virgibacillus sp. M23]QRZ17979.1 fumarylacetoacetate hydrolase family protein [Virgibacillus sp. AGTR]
MKLVNYCIKGKEESRIGCVLDNYVLDVQNAYRQLLSSHEKKGIIANLEKYLPSDASHFFAIGSSAIERAYEAVQYNLEKEEGENRIPLDDVRLKTPIEKPSKIICVGKNYANHVEEMKGEMPEYPVIFAKYNNALIGPEDVIEKPAFTSELDYEVELAVVIGKKASKVLKDDALNYVAGYAIANDTTARDLQKRTPQWLQGKTLDRSTPIGPWIVTTEELKDPSNLSIRSFVNGEERQSANTNQLIFDVPFLIQFISRLITLYPGDIIMTGTPDGVGFAREPAQFLHDGDVVKVEIEAIGQMENKIRE